MQRMSDGIEGKVGKENSTPTNPWSLPGERVTTVARQEAANGRASFHPEAHGRRWNFERVFNGGTIPGVAVADPTAPNKVARRLGSEEAPPSPEGFNGFCYRKGFKSLDSMSLKDHSNKPFEVTG